MGGGIPLEIFPFVILDASVRNLLVSASYLANDLRNLLIFC